MNARGLRHALDTCARPSEAGRESRGRNIQGGGALRHLAGATSSKFGRTSKMSPHKVGDITQKDTRGLVEKALTPPRRCLCVAMSRFCGVSNYTCLPRANVSLREVKRKLGHHLLRVIEHGVEPAVVRMSGSRSRGETHRPCGPRAPGSRRRTVPARRSWGGTRSGDGVRRRLFDWIFCGSDFSRPLDQNAPFPHALRRRRPHRRRRHAYRRPEPQRGAARRTSRHCSSRSWTHVATPRRGMLRLVGRTSRRLVTDCPCLLDAPSHRRPEPQRGC